MSNFVVFGEFLMEFKIYIRAYLHMEPDKKKKEKEKRREIGHFHH